ncbi:MAG: MarC family protein [Chloroflexi bacterium]|nr:MarC family protein [Chloroflexota bacterium]
MLHEKFIRDFLILWATIDPISTLLIFAALTRSMGEETRARMARKAAVYSGFILLGSLVVGQVILSALSISLFSFQVAGGIILFVFAIQLTFGKLTAEIPGLEEDQDLAVYPLAVPSTATPGAIIAVIVLTDNHIYSIGVQAGTAAITSLILFITYRMMRSADGILRLLGRQGAELLVRVMGLILASLSVELIFDAMSTVGIIR